MTSQRNTSDSNPDSVQPEPSDLDSDSAGASEASTSQDRVLLNASTLKRVQQGLSAARDRAVRRSIALALEQSVAVAEQDAKPQVSGWMRRGVLRSLIHMCFRVKIENPEYIPQGAAVIAANHLSHIDPFLLLAELPGQPYFYILGDARTLYNQWWKRQVLRWADGVIPLERQWKEEIAVMEAAKSDRPDLADLAADIEKHVPSGSNVQMLRQIDRTVQAILSRGDGIILFPEGRLGEVEGELYLPLKRGSVIYALRAGTPIVPAVLIGTQDLYLGKRLTIRFGEPLHWPRSHRPKRQEIDTALDQLQAALVALLPENYQEPKGPKLLRYFLNRMLW